MVFWVIKTLIVQFFCLFLLPLLNLSCFFRSLLFLSFIIPIPAWKFPLISPLFLKRFLVFPILLFPPISSLVHLRRPSYLFLLFSATLHSVWYIYPSLPCFLLFFFHQVFVKPPQTTTLPLCISFSWGWFWSLTPVQCCKLLSPGLQAL